MHKIKNIIIKILICITISFYLSNCKSNSMNIEQPRCKNCITQYGIRWTFDKEYKTGQFANGDYWVIGPVKIISITKPHSQNGLDGSMINPIGGQNGYDSRLSGYNPSLDVSRSLPFTLNVNQSLVSTISWGVEDPGCPALIANPPPAKPRPLLKVAAVLTCLASAPPAGTFRPPYSGSAKKIYNVSQLQWQILPSIAPVNHMYSLAEVEAWFEKPWIDHGTDYSFDEYLHPSENYTVDKGFGYGREIAWKTNDASLMLMINSFLKQEKEKLMIRLVQIGIDNYWAAENNAIWWNNGGHGSGRKWPILFAGLMLNNSDMKSLGKKLHSLKSWRFGEDEQTFYISQQDVARNIGYTTADIGKPEWGIRHYTEPNLDDPTWEFTSGNRGNGYRQHTASAWVSAALACRLMGSIKLWNWNAFFDYQDRYMKTEKGKYRSWTRFSELMWDKYR